VTPTSTIAHKGEVAGAKALADSVLDFMTSPDVLKAAHDEFEQATKTTPYFSLVPDGAKPDTDLDKDIMAQYRPAMSKFYLHKTPRYQP
jgi:aminobenzoyl-glutamate utilization protein B